MLDKATFVVAGTIALTTIAGCEAMGPRVGQSVTVEHGIVRRAEPVALNSTAAQGALIGGTLGLLLGGGSRAGGAITGAALGGVAGGLAGGERTGMSFTVEMRNGSSTRVVTDRREIRVGDCVAVERVGQGANIRRVSARYRDPANEPAVRAVDASSTVRAVQCENAKQELAEATTLEAANLAIRKIELLCN
jgi:uncharacterized protein YcfJ